jgi:C4-dicarboxylate-specific signal transduction histidine kinase
MAKFSQGASRGFRWVAAVLSVASAAVITARLREFFQATPNSLFFCAIILASWLGGFGPGLLASVLSILAIKFFFTAPYHTLAYTGMEAARFGVFLLAGVFISWISGLQRQAELALRAARDELEARVRGRTAELEKANQDLQRQEAYLSEAQRLSHTGSWAWDVKTKENVYWSAEHFRIYGFDPKTTVTPFLAARDRIHPDDVGAFDAAMARAIRDHSDFQSDHRVVFPNGSVRRLHTVGHPVLNEANDLVEFIGTIVDVTEQRRAEALLAAEKNSLEMIARGAPLQEVLIHLRALARPDDEPRSPEQGNPLLAERASHLAQIAIQRDRAQQSLRAAEASLAHATRVTTMGELTASIAHEVNQPLAAIMNNANACLDLLGKNSPDLAEVRAALSEIVQDSDRASAVIARVRKLSKKAPAEKTLLQIEDVVADVLAFARYELGARHVSVNTNIPPGLPAVAGDRVQLQQVLLNLIVNSMDAMHAVNDAQRLVAIHVASGQTSITVAVRDSGPGLKAEEMTRLFEAFYTTKAAGLGLGLAISRSIIEAHGGRLWAERHAGAGATFCFSLPIAEGAEK